MFVLLHIGPDWRQFSEGREWMSLGLNLCRCTVLVHTGSLTHSICTIINLTPEVMGFSLKVLAGSSLASLVITA